ncbi:MAG TPA: IclR family transcriptional regulator [Candidatus Dormibacteraeota bacterium]|nr:IclR family transcriptional regulator [Candidatus Dormibacteraeota bacterium]
MRNSLSSVGHAVRTLLLLRERQTVRVSEVAEALGVARSTAHRVLSTLCHYGFVVQARNRGAYRPGPQLVEVGLAALRGVDVRRVARPHLEALSAELRETVSLIIVQGDRSWFLDSVESMEPLRVTTRTGQAKPAHCTSGGKVLLAELGRESLRRLYPRERLPTVTARSIASRTELEAELEAVRERGYATNFEESEIGLSGVGVLIRDPEGRPLAAVAVAAPSSRLTDDRVARFARAARETAARIERDLRLEGLSRPT